MGKSEHFYISRNNLDVNKVDCVFCSCGRHKTVFTCIIEVASDGENYVVLGSLSIIWWSCVALAVRLSP